jgi:hypothetical protein
MSILGKKINAQKSKIYFLVNMHDSVANQIVKVLGFPVEQLLSSYLGLPFFMGPNKTFYWASIIDKIKARISISNDRWLSLTV